MAIYSIKDVENLTGIKAHTIRIWEKRYNILNPKRTETNIRYYDDDDLRRILNISILNKRGFKISYITKLSDSELRQKLEDISSVSSEFVTQVENLILSMIDLDERLFSDILSKAIMAHGFEQTFISLVFPFMYRIGLLWQTGTVNPGQEHFISNLIRNKIIVGIDTLNKEAAEKKKRFILFLPEGEIHEIGLLFQSYLIRKRGHEVVYLGQHTPIDSVIETDKVKPADIILTSLISTITGISAKEFATKLAAVFPNKKVAVTGRLATGVPGKKNILFFTDNPSLIKFLDKL